MQKIVYILDLVGPAVTFNYVMETCDNGCRNSVAKERQKLRAMPEWIAIDKPDSEKGI